MKGNSVAMKADNNYRYNENNVKKVEILAPAGSYDIMKAVIQAGADAVYLGGDFFGARAFAGNFHEQELVDAIGYAHQFNRKIYLTVNTLLKETEINDRLIDYLTPFYKAGLDAVIVQDFGVFSLIRKHFPDMHIHASTQMTQTGAYGAKLLYEAGAARVVTSRELELNEIKAIHDSCDVEIESFIHGALCYCYSGQCLLSSFNGGRSGNRGRCAQPCRLAYNVYDITSSADNAEIFNNKPLNQREQQYVTSPKDMCALTVLPDIIDAGVYSLKIEGRMKNVTYAAGVTAIYRKYVDMYLDKGRKGYKVDQKDINDLMDIYNRGAFTEGYYTCDKGESMISLLRPNHMGTKALRVIDNVNGRITFKALEHINVHDVFEIDKEHSFSSGSDLNIGSTMVVNLPKKYNLKPGMDIYRTRNDALTQWVNKEFTEEHLKISVNMSFTAMTDSEMSLTIYSDSDSVTVLGPVVTKAEKHPVSEDKIKEQLTKLGDTAFLPDHIEVLVSEDAFVPASQLNELRREAVRQLLESVRSKGRRSYKKIEDTMESCNIEDIKQIKENSQFKENIPEKHVLIHNIAMLDTVLKHRDIAEIYFDYNILYNDFNGFCGGVAQVHKFSRRAILALPHILKEKNKQKFLSLINKAESVGLDGYLVRNLEEIGLLNEAKSQKSVYTDSGLYITNSHSSKQLESFGRDLGVDIEIMTLPLELTSSELVPVTSLKSELVVYAKIPMMISEQCIRKTFNKCNHNNGSVMMENKSNKYLVKSNCSFCYTVTYGEKPLNIINAPEIGSKLKPGSIRYEFVSESFNEIDRVLSGLTDDTQENLTTGHFYRGVE